MSEPLPQPRHPGTTVEVTDPSPELARRNVLFGLALFAVSLLIFGGTILIALAYLHFD